MGWVTTRGPHTTPTRSPTATAVSVARSLRLSRPLSATRINAAPCSRLQRAHDLQHIARARFGELPDDRAVGEKQNAIGDLRTARIVRHHHDRLAVLPRRVAQQLEDLAAGLRVKIARGLIGEQDR